MDRKKIILKYANKTALGLEVAPYHSPIAPKKEGWNCMSLDFFDTDKLIDIANSDPNVSSDNIENVDIVSSAVVMDEAISELGLLGSFDYICSSHNFEHLPDPLRFLIAAGNVLKKNGYLSMAIPNKRFTFDYSRPLTGTKDFFKNVF